MRNGLLLLLCLLCAGLFQGCAVVCQHPLSDPKAKEVDERLLGTWRWMDEDRTYFLHIAQAAKDEGAHFALVEVNPGSGVDVTEGNLFTTKIGEHLYASVQLKGRGEGKDGKEVSEQYIPVFYEFSKEGRLIWGLADGISFEKAVDEKKIKGKVVDRKLRAVELSASTEELVAFLKENAPARFFKTIEGGIEKLEPPKATEKPAEEERKK